MAIKNQNKEVPIDIINLPADSAEFVKTVKKEHEITAINPYLSHNRFYRYIKIEYAGKRPVERRESLLFKRLQKVPVCEADFCCDGKSKPSELKKISEMLNERNRVMAGSLPGKKCPYIFRSDSKLICGMGGTSPYGNIQLLRLHHVFGIPYIPASVIKGSLRSYIILENYSGNEERAENTKEFKELFGTTADGMQAEGKLVFFDAFPTRFIMGLDAQTPHFKKYYEGTRQNPLDNENPVPLFFTCLQDAEFQVYISCREAAVWERYKKMVDQAVRGVFENYGIGAKTSLGYGGGKVIE